MQRVTIKDIARLAGVSLTTVSRALNGSDGISEETRERVLRLCREQGYRTNLLARSLSSSRTHVLGLILPDISLPFYAALSLDIETFARERNYQVMLCCGRPGDGQIEGLLDLLISQRVDGVLLGSSSDAAQHLLASYHHALPSVLLGASPPDTGSLRVNTVSVDNYTGGRMAASYLHRLGHRQVIYLGMRPDSASHRLRYQGFLSAAGELGLQVETVYNPAPSSSIESGFQMASSRFAAPLVQTALFAASDAIALGAIQAADQAGISIPEQLSVLGFDNIEYAALPNIRLTTLSQNAPALARAAVRLLLELVEAEERNLYTCKLLTPTLIERSTCRSL